MQDRSRFTFLHRAARRGHAESAVMRLRALFASRADLRSELTPLHSAVWTDNIEIFTVLLEAEIDPNPQDRCGFTPLHCCAWTGNLEILTALLGAGADCNAQDCSGCIPLHCAAWLGNPEVLAALLAADSDVNAKDRFGDTPLHRAAEGGHAEAVTALLKAGSDANAHTPGLSAFLHSEVAAPLHRAAKTRLAEAVTALRKSRADATTRTTELLASLRSAGATPLHRTATEHLGEAVTRMRIAEKFGFQGDAASAVEFDVERALDGVGLLSRANLQYVNMAAAAAAGAGAGAVADISVGGLSVGTGAVVGGAAGAVLTGGRTALRQLRGQEELRLRDDAVKHLAARAVATVRAMLVRGHAAVETVSIDAAVKESLASDASPDWRKSWRKARGGRPPGAISPSRPRRASPAMPAPRPSGMWRSPSQIASESAPSSGGSAKRPVDRCGEASAASESEFRPHRRSRLPEQRASHIAADIGPAHRRTPPDIQSAKTDTAMPQPLAVSMMEGSASSIHPRGRVSESSLVRSKRMGATFASNSRARRWPA